MFCWVLSRWYLVYSSEREFLGFLVRSSKLNFMRILFTLVRGSLWAVYSSEREFCDNLVFSSEGNICGYLVYSCEREFCVEPCKWSALCYICILCILCANFACSQVSENWSLSFLVSESFAFDSTVKVLKEGKRGEVGWRGDPQGLLVMAWLPHDHSRIQNPKKNLPSIGTSLTEVSKWWWGRSQCFLLPMRFPLLGWAEAREEKWRLSMWQNHQLFCFRNICQQLLLQYGQKSKEDRERER